MSSTRPIITILLATRNGEKYLSEQLESFRAQTYPHWALLVSDDGSTDRTLHILKEFAASVAQAVIICQGPQLGFWQNFVSLVRRDELSGDLYSYSDQDDIWFAYKLANAVDWFLKQPPNVPAVYFTRTELINRDGSPAGFSRLFKRKPSFANALVQNIGGGNTMVFNQKARALLCATPEMIELVAHDWWTYQIVTGSGGLSYYDATPSLRYRQHGDNLMGKNVGFGARLARLEALVNGKFVKWNNINQAALRESEGYFQPEHRATLELFTRARAASLPKRIWLLWRSGVYRQGIVETLALYLSAILRKL